MSDSPNQLAPAGQGATSDPKQEKCVCGHNGFSHSLKDGIQGTGMCCGDNCQCEGFEFPTPVRETFIDFDSHPKPKTEQYCVKCQKDLKTGRTFRYVFVTKDMMAVHPDDLSARPVDSGDFGWKLIGLDCAKQLGIEFTAADKPLPAPSAPRVCTCPESQWIGSEPNDSTCQLSEEEHESLRVAPSAPQESAEPAKTPLVKETKYSIRVTREFVDNVEKRIGMGRNAWDVINHRQLCEEVIAEYQAQSAPQESAEEAWNLTMESVRFPDKAGLPYRVVYNGNSLMSICSDADSVVVALPPEIPRGRHTYFQSHEKEARSMHYMVWAANNFLAVIAELKKARAQIEEAHKRGQAAGFNEGVEASAAVHDAAATNYRRNRLLTDEGIQALWAAIIRQLKHPSDRSEQE